MGHKGNRKENNPDWKITLMGNRRHIRVDQPKGHLPPMGNNYKAPYLNPSPTGI